jgi:hypothetical protein
MREPANEGPAGWMKAWESKGEVVLPHRRRPLWWRAGLTLLLTANSCLSLLTTMRDEPALFKVVTTLAIPCWAWFFGYTVWQLITGRPILRIDRAGIHYGTRKRFQLSWDRIDTISDPIGKWLFAYLNIRPYDENPRRIPISHLHVEDLHPFARWLRVTLEAHRNASPATEDGQAPR